MTSPDFDSFRNQALAQGFDEVIERLWQPDAEVPLHTHPFAVSALVVEGGFCLQTADAQQQLGPGDRFELAADVPHAERYGAAGARLWVARRHPPAAASSRVLTD